jgi:lysozyme family protein
MQVNFKRSLDFTLSFEGGYVNHPQDPGGHTNRGVTLATLRRYRPGATVADLKRIPSSLVAQIYRDGYWEKAGCDTLAPGVDGATFDYACNSGPRAARKSLMAVLGGPAHETVKALCKRRLSIYQTLKHWKTFGRGWTRRVTAGEALWVSWALAATVDTPHVETGLADESARAGKTASAQNKGGLTTGATGGGAGVAPGHEDVIAGWFVAGGALVLISVAAWLLWRAHVNRQRARAYANEARQVGGASS